VLCGAVVGRASDRKRSGGGGVQELDWEEIEADLGGVEGGKTQSNGNALRNKILRPMEKLLEIRKMMTTKD